MDCTGQWYSHPGAGARCPGIRLSASPQLAASHATLADAAVMPFVRQFAMVDQAWFDSQPWPRLQAWLSSWIACELFERAMQKYEPWKPGEAGVDFPPPR